MKGLKWIGNGEVPLRTPIEYRFASWGDSMPWVETRIMYLSDHIVVLEEKGIDVSYDRDVVSRMIFQPKGGLIESEYKEFLHDIVGVVEATRHEKFCLWKENHEAKRVEWNAGNSGPIVTIGKVDGRSVAISLLVDEVGGHRVLFVDATSEIVDWAMIDKWLERNVPSSAYREGSQYINKQDAGNFWNVLPRKKVEKPLGMQSSASNHSPSCNRQRNGTFCDCGFS